MRIEAKNKEIMRVNEQLYVQVHTDELAGLFNWRFLDEILPNSWEDCLPNLCRSPMPFITVRARVYSSVPGEQDTPDGFLSQADNGLYRAKENGKNRMAQTGL